MDDLLKTFKEKNKAASIWTVEQGCLLFTSLIIFYLIFLSSQGAAVLDIIVTIFFILGALVFYTSSTVLKTYKHTTWGHWLQRSIEYVFMALSFLPGLYFAFVYEDFILRFYLFVHFVTTAYFFYKRYKEFEMEPFLIGVAMSFALGIIHPFLRGFFYIFGTGWFISTISSLVVSTVDIGIAVAFMLRLPEKHLPSNMMFGLKVVKYLMFISYWQTWFILMVLATWRNIGAAAETLNLDTPNPIAENPTEIENENLVSRRTTTKSNRED